MNSVLRDRRDISFRCMSVLADGLLATSAPPIRLAFVLRLLGPSPCSSLSRVPSHVESVSDSRDGRRSRTIPPNAGPSGSSLSA